MSVCVAGVQKNNGFLSWGVPNTANLALVSYEGNNFFPFFSNNPFYSKEIRPLFSEPPCICRECPPANKMERKATGKVAQFSGRFFHGNTDIRIFLLSRSFFAVVFHNYFVVLSFWRMVIPSPSVRHVTGVPGTLLKHWKIIFTPPKTQKSRQNVRLHKRKREWSQESLPIGLTNWPKQQCATYRLA